MVELEVMLILMAPPVTVRHMVVMVVPVAVLVVMLLVMQQVQEDQTDQTEEHVLVLQVVLWEEKAKVRAQLHELLV